MADPPLRHHGHALLDARLGRDVDERRGHDLAHERLLLGASLERDAPQVVALGHDPGDPSTVGDEERADVRSHHPLDRLEDRRLRVDREHLAPFPLQDLRDVAHELLA